MRSVSTPQPRLAAVGALLSAVALGGACQQSERHPSLLARECADASSLCFPAPVSGSGGSDAAADAAPSSDAAGEMTRTVRGSIVLYDDDGFLSAQHFDRPAVVSADGAAASRVSTSYDGATFTLADARVAAQNWFFIEPSAGVDAFPTLEPIDTRVDPVELAIVRASVLELIYGLLELPVSVDAGAGHVVLRFFDSVTNQAMSGVSVAMAQAGVVAYAEGGTWSDVSTSTGAPGLAIVGNVAASPPPGSRQPVTIAGTASGTVEVVVARGVVSVVDVPIDR